MFFQDTIQVESVILQHTAACQVSREYVCVDFDCLQMRENEIRVKFNRLCHVSVSPKRKPKPIPNIRMLKIIYMYGMAPTNTEFSFVSMAKR